MPNLSRSTTRSRFAASEILTRQRRERASSLCFGGASALLGANSAERLDQNLDALDRVDFGADELAAIDEFAVDRGSTSGNSPGSPADVAVDQPAPLEVRVWRARRPHGQGGQSTAKTTGCPPWPYARKVATASPSPTPNPDAMKFTLDTTLPERLDVTSAQAAVGVPFAQAVFAAGGVAAVFGVNDFVTVRRQPGREWEPIVAAVIAAAAAHL